MEREKAEQEKEKAKEEKKKFPCSRCEKTFDTIADRDQHGKSVHNAPPPCPVCHQTYSTKGHLKKHLINLHTYSKEDAKMKGA